ncbi:MAG: nitrous oxide-stimulated promoter family protein [Candidatus Delongbacteria bacterium]
MPTRPAHSDTRRIHRELKTVHAMLRLHCRHRHGARELCAECAPLWDYARARVEACPFCPDKPTCVNCPVHCYKPEMRERIRRVMRYAGPRMLWRHPWLALLHLWDGRQDRQRESLRRRAARTTGPERAEPT